MTGLLHDVWGGRGILLRVCEALCLNKRVERQWPNRTSWASSLWHGAPKVHTCSHSVHSIKKAPLSPSLLGHNHHTSP